MAKMTEDELGALVGHEMRASLGYQSSKLSNARQKAEIYYLGLPVGDLAPPEVEGRSTVVSTDVRDTVESMLPQLMVTFTGSDCVCEFEATKPQDEPKAKIISEYINYIFSKQNNGHQIAYTWMKDALLQKNGIVKVWWDNRVEETKESYRGLDQVELAQLLDDEEVEVIDQATYPDEEDAKQRQQALEQLQQQMQQAMQDAQMGNPQAQQAVQQMQQRLEQINATPPVMLFDVSVKRSKKAGKVCIENVPPEEFLISRNAKDIKSARFVGHRVLRTASELKSMGYKNVDQLSGEDMGQAQNFERITRLSWNDENAWMDDAISTDESQRHLWVIEAYIRCDYDGDGISELRKVTMAGNTVLDNEEVDVCPFVSITPVPLPHVFYGLSIADLAMEPQRTKTAIRRALLDQLFLSVNGRYYAVDGQVNLDDLLTSRPGGVVRIKTPGAVGRLDQTAGDVGFAMEMLQEQQQDLENRTGWTRYSQGNDSQGLNQTATGVSMIANRADMRLDLIARNFAEGFSELFNHILRLVCQYQDKAAEVKLSGGWITVDPREWRNKFSVTINVGLGTGDKVQKVQAMQALLMAQQQAFPLGIANPSNVYNALAEMATLMGYKAPEKFFTDPSKSPPPPQPNPEQLKAQAQMQLEQAKMQATMQLEQAKMQFQAQMEQQKMQQEAQLDALKRDHEIQLEKAKLEFQAMVDTNRQQAEAQQKTLEMQQQAELDQLKAQIEQERHAKEQEFQAWKAKLDAETKVLVAQIAASAKSEGKETVEEPGEEAAEQQVENVQQNALAMAMQGFTEALNSLRQPRTIVRGPDGRAQGII